MNQKEPPPNIIFSEKGVLSIRTGLGRCHCILLSGNKNPTVNSIPGGHHFLSISDGQHPPGRYQGYLTYIRIPPY